MASDPNPALRAELNAALGVLNPQIRGMRDIVNDNISPELHAALISEILNRERRRDLILVVIAQLDDVVASLRNLEADGYPALPDIQTPDSVLTELQKELSDVQAARDVFTAIQASTLKVEIGEFTDDSKPRTRR